MDKVRINWEFVILISNVENIRQSLGKEPDQCGFEREWERLSV